MLGSCGQCRFQNASLEHRKMPVHVGLIEPFSPGSSGKSMRQVLGHQATKGNLAAILRAMQRRRKTNAIFKGLPASPPRRPRTRVMIETLGCGF
jgi:hypothetical protein